MFQGRGFLATPPPQGTLPLGLLGLGLGLLGLGLGLGLRPCSWALGVGSEAAALCDRVAN